MLKKFTTIFYSFSNNLTNKNFELYQSIYGNIEKWSFQKSLNELYQLQKQNLIDKQLWQKLEEQFMQHFNHIDIDQIVNYSYFINKNKSLQSLRGKTLFEQKLKKLHKKLTIQQLNRLTEYIFPHLSLNLQRILIHEVLSQNSNSYIQELKNILCILEYSSISPQLVIQKLEAISNTTQLSSCDEIILYLQLFYSNKIENWAIAVERREKLNQIIQGYEQQNTILKKNYKLLELEDIAQQIQILAQNENNFKNFLTQLQYLRACRYKKYQFNFNKEIQQLYNVCYLQLTPLEIIQMVSELSDIIDKVELIQSLQKYIEKYIDNLNNNDFIMFQRVNLKYLECEKISQLILSNIKFTMESILISEISIILNLLEKSKTKQLIQFVQEKEQQALDILYKLLQIHSIINVDISIQITKLFILDNEHLKQLWQKTEITKLEQLTQTLAILREELNKKKLSEQQLKLIHDILRSKFALVN